jgi:hypothetical protein
MKPRVDCDCIPEMRARRIIICNVSDDDGGV